MTLTLCVVGATGNVGREMLAILHERQFPLKRIVPLASVHSQGKEVSYGDKFLKVQALENTDIGEFDLCLMSAGGAVAKEWAPRFAKKGVTVIDNSSTFRYDSDVPLVVPEVNPQALAGATKRRIIANPNCSTAQLVVALKPLHDAAQIERVFVSTYQSVSGAGKQAMDALFRQTRTVFTADQSEDTTFPKRMAFNVIPHIDTFIEGGMTREEWKVVAETKKILDPKIKISCMAVRVPVFVGHGEAVNISFKKDISAEEARKLLEKAPGCCVLDRREPGGYATPIDVAGKDAVYISRIHDDPSLENGLTLWIVADNLRKGAALNAIQIAERLYEDGYFSGSRK